MIDIDPWALIRQLNAGSESDREFNGFVSYSAEWHMLAVGLSFGVFSALTTAWVTVAFILVAIGIIPLSELYKLADAPVPQGIKEMRKEPHYAIGGALFGYVLAIGIETIAASTITAAVPYIVI